VRAGAHALSLLSVPLNVNVITALAEEPRPLADLRSIVGMPPPTTMRKHLRTLTQLGILERQRQTVFPGSVDYELGRAGRELLPVIEVLGGWLATSPSGSLELGTTSAKSAIRALTDGWSSTIVRALSARPLSLTELNRLIASINYPSLERRLSAMRLAGQVTSCQAGGRRRPYAATDWLRRAIGPIAAAAGWEREYDAEAAAQVSRIDVESAFLLAIPLLRLPADVSGTARLTVGLQGSEAEAIAGVLVEVEEGSVVSCVSRLGGHAEGWASGSVRGWISAVLYGRSGSLEVGGDSALTQALVEGLHNDLFLVPQAS
jgi:DNA-binding HxlR family transcriptional regulator